MIPPAKKLTASTLNPTVEPDLAPPAEWLLLNANSGGTAEPELLAEALVMEHYPALLQAARALHGGTPAGDAARAAAALLEALAQAVQEAFRYPRGAGVRAWLAGFLLAGSQPARPTAAPLLCGADFINEETAWQAFRKLPPAARLALALELLLDWPLAEIEQVPGLEDAGPALAASEREVLRRALAARIPAAALSDDELERVAQAAARRAAQGASRRRRKAAVKEMVLIGITILGVALIIFAANRLLPDEPAPASPGFPVFATPTPARGLGSFQPVPTRTPLWRDHVAYVAQRGDTLESVAQRAGMSVEDLQRINALAQAEPLYSGQPLWVLVPGFSSGASAGLAPIPDQPDFTINLTPLDAHSSPEAIVERMRHSRRQWHSLWMDLQMAYYGPKSYHAEPRAYRSQVWVDRQKRSLELYNDLSSQPETRHITLNGRSYTSALNYSGAYLNGDWRHPPKVLLSNPLLRDMIFPGDSYLVSERSYLTPKGLDRVAGREALVVSWLFPASSWSFRLWIDTRLGIILRRQHIEAATGYLISDLTATDITVDVEMPSELFNPLLAWDGSFARSYLGERAPFDSLAPTPTWALPTQRPPVNP